jgi:hypothetical protein
MHIRIHGTGRRIQLSPLFEVLTAADERSHWDDWSARGFFRQHFRDAHDIGSLRSALASEIHHVNRLSDDDLIAAAAQRLCSGAWRIGYDGVPPARVAGIVSKAAGKAAPLRQGGSTRPRAQGPRASGPAPARAPAASTPAEPEWPEQADQLAFAQVLEQAAEEGTPFCEICAKMAQENSLQAA